MPSRIAGPVICPRAARPEQLYDQDFYAWTQFQARELHRLARAQPDVSLDLPHIAEEIRDLGREQRARLRGWTVRITTHLLLLEHGVPEERRRASIREVMDCRSEIAFRESPALLRDLNRQLPRLYAQARRHAVLWLEDEAEGSFPASCPYTLDQVLGDWWPDEPGRRNGDR